MNASNNTYLNNSRGFYFLCENQGVTLLQASERRCGLGDEAYVVNDVTGLGRGRWRHVRASTVVGNNGAEAPGRTRQWHGGSEEDSTMM
jgi:hypothetical protein